MIRLFISALDKLECQFSIYNSLLKLTPLITFYIKWIIIYISAFTQHPCNPILLRGRVGHQETTNNSWTQAHMSYMSQNKLSVLDLRSSLISSLWLWTCIIIARRTLTNLEGSNSREPTLQFVQGCTTDLQSMNCILEIPWCILHHPTLKY